MHQLTTKDARFWAKLHQALGPLHQSNAPTEAVAEILSAVKKEGDQAVARFAAKFDRVDCSPGDFRVPVERLRTAFRNLSPEIKDALRQSHAGVEAFHQAAKPKNWTIRNPHGALVGERFYPLQRVGLYIPGGQVPLVSTVIMTATLARLAKVPEVAVFTPPGRDGWPDDALLGALHYLGIQEVYRLGGVQAMGAMAYGTESIPAVRKIFGPGNAYVVEAKRQLYGTVGIDLLPGPSEVMVIADESARPDWVAADLLSQAEHGPGGIIFLVTTSTAQRTAINQEVRRQMKGAGHLEILQKVMGEGYFAIVAHTPEAIIEVANRIAPEHLELMVERKLAIELEKRITTAGAMLSGVWTPTAVGDFTAGPSHVLPTGSAGVFSSGLRIEDFYRRSSYVRYDRKSVRQAEPITSAFAAMENLPAHGASVRLRMGKKVR